jgi:hypothetical protein
MSLTQEDIKDIKTVLNEQFDSIQRLGKMPVSGLDAWKDYQTIYQDILECNKVMMEIISGPTGGIIKIIERNV